MGTTTLLSNPPYNIKWEHPVFAQLQSRFAKCEIPPESNANFAFVLTGIEKSDRSIFLLPNSVLTSKGKEEEIRKHLIESNLIEAVILNPDRMFESTGIETCILVLDKHKDTAKVEMIDLREKYKTEIREQNGQYGGKSHTARTYKKEIKIITDDQIEDVLACIAEQKDISGYCKSVSIADIKEEGYNLSPARYISQDRKEPQRRPYKEIAADITRITKERNVLKLTVNVSIAKNIGLYEIYELEKQSNEAVKRINEVLKSLEVDEIPSSNYLQVSKNKNEFKFENTSKEKLSNILLLILQQWKQHLHYLNEEENRYLAELRDALLPDLINGKITLENEQKIGGTQK